MTVCEFEYRNPIFFADVALVIRDPNIAPEVALATAYMSATFGVWSETSRRMFAEAIAERFRCARVPIVLPAVII